MKDELDARLCKKYPKIFADRDGNMQETCMYWGLAVGNGWYHIIDMLCSSIQGHISNNERTIQWTVEHNKIFDELSNGDTTTLDKKYKTFLPEWRARHAEDILKEGHRKVKKPIEQVVAKQVKEKFGGLRFYTRGGDEYTHGILDLAESLSFRTCDVCGGPGRPGGKGWIATRCKKHTGTDWDKVENEESKILKLLGLDDETLAEIDKKEAEWNATRAKQETNDE